ncbi:hypothetical protein SpAn4DRAFT_2631 [Sporomusa ovata]|uniref:Uncharacterized protein n=1 Tax=Sporomusa ovata TaxID=2378 RepID=A0A0U1L242_9FIRM|nr:hypothetical protein SpAn4DRAFT_2631 [Sporomusa ovata]
MTSNFAKAAAADIGTTVIFGLAGAFVGLTGWSAICFAVASGGLVYLVNKGISSWKETLQ